MKLRYILTAMLAVCLASCSQTPGGGADPEVDNSFTLLCNPELYDGTTLTVEGRDTTVVFTVDASEYAQAWKLRCALDDSWCSYSKNGSELAVTLSGNKTKEDRFTWFMVVIGDNTHRVTVRQKFVPKPPYVPTSGTSPKAVSVDLTKYVDGDAVEDIDFAKYPTYDILDPDGAKIGELCEEFLFKKDGPKFRAIVAYACFEGEMNYEQGCVVSNGGTVEWNEKTNLIASYTEGTLAAPATVIYMNRGETCFSTEPYVPEDETVEEIVGTLRPVYVVDHRAGAANNEGQTEETFVYTVQKIGLQYWQRENLKASRQIDGTPIATSFTEGSSGTWAKMFNTTIKPGCLITFATSGISRTKMFNVNAQDEDVVAARNLYGILYDWACLVGNEMPVNGNDYAGPFNDMLAPEGWAVPTKSQFTLFYAYITQESTTSTEYLNLVMLPTADPGKKLDDSHPYRNITGFGAIGGAWCSAKGGYNAYTCYMTSQYDGYQTSAQTGQTNQNYYGHLTNVATFRSDNNTQFSSLSCLCGVNVRLIRK